MKRIRTAGVVLGVTGGKYVVGIDLVGALVVGNSKGINGFSYT